VIKQICNKNLKFSPAIFTGFVKKMLFNKLFEVLFFEIIKGWENAKTQKVFHTLC